jgi:hypothetical protein
MKDARFTALALLLAALPLISPAHADTKAKEITIRNGAVVGEKSLRASRGDLVILRWRSDRRVELHLHGYDVSATVTPEAPAEMKIDARATGRFPVEIHGAPPPRGGHGHKTIFYLEVYPE